VYRPGRPSPRPRDVEFLLAAERPRIRDLIAPAVRHPTHALAFDSDRGHRRRQQDRVYSEAPLIYQRMLGIEVLEFTHEFPADCDPMAAPTAPVDRC